MGRGMSQIKPTSWWRRPLWLWWACCRTTRRRWNRLRGKREVFYTMDMGATRLNPEGVVTIQTSDEEGEQ